MVITNIATRKLLPIRESIPIAFETSSISGVGRQITFWAIFGVLIAYNKFRTFNIHYFTVIFEVSQSIRMALNLPGCSIIGA